MDERLRQLLRDLSRALSDAVGDSNDVGDSIRRIKREGYTVHMLIDCRKEEDSGEPRASGFSVHASAGDPMFRINATDLLFLRSIGIDPTRRRRSRSKRVIPTAETDPVSD